MFEGNMRQTGSVRQVVPPEVSLSLSLSLALLGPRSCGGKAPPPLLRASLLSWRGALVYGLVIIILFVMSLLILL